MPTNRIPVHYLLSTEERKTLDLFGADYTGDLEAAASLLSQQFGVTISIDPDIIQGFATDSSNLPGSAVGLGRPTSVREMAVLFRLCFAAGIPYTLSAGKSNLTGSATPEEGMVISTLGMMEPAVKVENSTVHSPVGIIVEDLRAEVLKQTDSVKCFPVDPTSRADAAVGGAIACNASGFIPGEEGSMRPWVAGLNFMLPDGGLIQATRGEYVSEDGAFILDGEKEVRLPIPDYPRPAIKNAGGPYSSADGVMDFVDLVVGSEGILGAVTECQLTLRDQPEGHLDLLFSLPTEEDALKLYDVIAAHLDGEFGKMTAFEYFGVNSRKYMDHEGRIFAGDHQVAVNIQIPLGGQDIEDAAEEWLTLLMEADCGVDEDGILLLDNEKDWKIFMEARHSMPANALEVVQHRGTFTIMTDTVVARDKFGAFLDFTHSLLGEKNLDYLSFGHLGDCHLHFTILPEKEQIDTGRDAYEQIIAKSAELGGIYSGEHGTGKRKRLDFRLCHGDAAAEKIREVKAAVDPRFLLNRGNVVEAP